LSKVYFTSDLHLGHKNIIKFSGEHGRQGSNSKEHDEWIHDSWNSIVKKRDMVWVLGDVAMGRPGTKDEPGSGWDNLAKVGKLNGNKKVILGNHDDMPIEAYMKYFQVVRGMDRYRGHWLTHSPIHPAELRGRYNIHGHVHHNTVQKLVLDPDTDSEYEMDDPDYINVCVEANIARNGSILVEWEELMLPTHNGWVKDPSKSKT